MEAQYGAAFGGTKALRVHEGDAKRASELLEQTFKNLDEAERTSNPKPEI
jgi:hypothetical protein